jgi:rubredoxin
MSRRRCKVCGYDPEEEGTSFEALPEGWVCPVCGADREAFIVKEWE